MSAGLVSTALLTALALPAQAGALRVGVGKVSITPPPEIFPYVAHGERDFVGVHDDIYARALVIDDGQRRVAIVVAEVTKIPEPDRLLADIARRAGIPASNVLLAASHTHVVPLFSYHGGDPNPSEQREIARLNRGTLEAVDQALHNFQSAQVSFGRGTGWVNVNNGEQAGLTKSYDPLGPSDKTLDLVRFSTPNGAPLALLINYATHGEVMFRSVTKNGGYEVSGDIPGAVSRLLETQPGPAPVVLFSSAAEADQLTLFKSLQPAGKLPATDEGAAGWALLDVQARRLAGSAQEILDAMPTGTSQVQIAAAQGTAVCPGQQWRRDPNGGAATVEDRPDVSIPLTAFRINDIVIAGVGGDVGSDIGRAFKAASPWPHTTLVTMTAGAVGYIFPDASYEHPGHGLMGSPLKPHCAETAVVHGLMDLLNRKP